MQSLHMFFFAGVGAIVGGGGGVAWSLHDTVTNGNNMFGHWFPAVITAAVGATIGLIAGSGLGLVLNAFRQRQINPTHAVEEHVPTSRR